MNKVVIKYNFNHLIYTFYQATLNFRSPVQATTNTYLSCPGALCWLLEQSRLTLVLHVLLHRPGSAQCHGYSPSEGENNVSNKTKMFRLFQTVRFIKQILHVRQCRQKGKEAKQREVWTCLQASVRVAGTRALVRL